MTAPHSDRAERLEGERRNDAAHALLEARREAWVRRGRRALLAHLITFGRGTADDVADRLGQIPADIDPRWLGTVPGRLARAEIIRAAGFEKSCRPSRHASIVTVWELVDRDAATAWLGRNPDVDSESEGDGAETSCATSPTPSPLVLSASSQSLLF